MGGEKEKRRGIKVEELVIAPIFCLNHLKNRALFCDMGEVHKKIGISTDGV